MSSFTHVLASRRLPPTVAALFTSFFFVAAAMAQDLKEGVDKASGEVKSVAKVGTGLVSILIVVIGLLYSAFKFSRKDPDAVWHLVSTMAAAAIVGIASVML